MPGQKLFTPPMPAWASKAAEDDLIDTILALKTESEARSLLQALLSKSELLLDLC
jgi:hypothetical protein